MVQGHKEVTGTQTRREKKRRPRLRQTDDAKLDLRNMGVKRRT
jgi:hypothetical protein